MSDGNNIYDGPSFAEADPIYEDDLDPLLPLSGNSENPKCSETDPAERDWEQIESQLNHWRDMDIEYWRQRKEKEYTAYLESQISRQQNKTIERTKQHEQN